ncbi:SCP domain-containing protein [Caenorhabditis elegans]|uniref:SCP domain-containing protein n=1 Tax=Caenorhabditis elegans TaxID=6239 RepID=Q9NEK0_CAEEL|nr:SCP domain-containing protein [Caenorhabditis elegans]CAB81977.2 SCP domain-containing protein [Caenorhabditis elegans]|eukprot:NP_507846.2 Uncharacterized protein CELE_Y116F11B.8 [Caenorhabditis elegans]
MISSLRWILWFLLLSVNKEVSSDIIERYNEFRTTIAETFNIPNMWRLEESKSFNKMIETADPPADGENHTLFMTSSKQETEQFERNQLSNLTKLALLGLTFEEAIRKARPTFFEVLFPQQRYFSWSGIESKVSYVYKNKTLKMGFACYVGPLNRSEIINWSNKTQQKRCKERCLVQPTRKPSLKTSAATSRATDAPVTSLPPPTDPPSTLGPMETPPNSPGTSSAATTSAPVTSPAPTEPASTLGPVVIPWNSPGTSSKATTSATVTSLVLGPTTFSSAPQALDSSLAADPSTDPSPSISSTDPTTYSSTTAEDYDEEDDKKGDEEYDLILTFGRGTGRNGTLLVFIVILWRFIDF